MLDLDTRLLRAFVAVSEDLSFTRAAARLYVAQQALSAQIQQLETRVGTRLFDRTTRKVSLTDAGEIGDEVMRRIERDLDLEVSRLDA